MKLPYRSRIQFNNYHTDNLHVAIKRVDHQAILDISRKGPGDESRVRSFSLWNTNGRSQITLKSFLYWVSLRIMYHLKNLPSCASAAQRNHCHWNLATLYHYWNFDALDLNLHYKNNIISVSMTLTATTGNVYIV